MSVSVQRDFFISRAGIDAAWAVWIANVLEDAGFSTYYQDGDSRAGPSFQEHMEAGAECNCTVAILSPEYFQSPHCLLEFRAAAAVARLLLVRVRPCKVPTLYAHLVYLDLTDKNEIQAKQLILNEILGSRVVQRVSFPGKAYSPVFPVPSVVSISKLPSVSPLLVGREKELALISDAWVDRDQRLVGIVAFGGVGKTALAINWWHSTAAPGAECVLGWSFYSQGSKEGRQASADSFLDYALRQWCKISDLPTDSWQRGELLAAEIRRKRTLLILDGLEPIQFPPGPQYGRFRDAGMVALLKELAAQNPGLCVCTSRFPLKDLEDYAPSGMVTIDLDNLTPESGAEFLRKLGVRGDEGQLLQGSTDFGNHALALTLLGNLLRRYGGDINKRTSVPSIFSAKDGEHARRVLRAYETIFEGKSEISTLRILGLFDRPADAGALAAVRCLPFDDWAKTLENLKDARLVEYVDPAGAVDTHAIVREHFSGEFSASDPTGFRNAHQKLYNYYSAQAPYRPDTLESMMPLIYAVYHGCQAGLHQQVCDQVYDQRIQRDMEFFLLNSLGAFGTNLSLLANFFESPWLKANAGLDKKTQGWIIGTSGFALRAVGRLAEAVETIETGFEAAIQANDNVSAARDLNNLSDLNLTLGNIDKAIEVGMRSIRISDECADPLLPIINRARTAYALLQSGATIQARLLFEEAGTLIKNAPNPFSLSVISDYNELLLDDQNRTKVLQRAEESLKTATTLLHVALGHLFLGRAHSSGSQESAFHLEQAVAGFRRANQLDELPRGLLARARNHRFSGDLQKAQHDLDEVRILSARCGMRLYLSDYHLEQAELFLSQCELAAARSHCESAHRMVQEAGYHRRDPAVAHLAFALQKSQSR